MLGSSVAFAISYTFSRSHTWGFFVVYIGLLLLAALAGMVIGKRMVKKIQRKVADEFAAPQPADLLPWQNQHLCSQQKSAPR